MQTSPMVLDFTSLPVYRCVLTIVEVCHFALPSPCQLLVRGTSETTLPFLVRP